MAVASQIAVAMQNGRLFGQLQRKALELDRLHAFNDDILESLEHGLIVTDGDGRITRWNRAMVALYGVTAIEAVGQPLSATAGPSLLALVEQLRTRPEPMAVTLRATIQRRSSDASSATRLVNITRLPVRRPDGATADGDMIIVEDLTHRTQLEEQLRLSEKMASLGVLAAGVAHEVNTPLTGISSYTQLLMEQMPDGSPERRMLEKIETQAFRAARIVNGLLHLSRSAPVDDAERRVVDLNAVVGDVMALLEPQLEKARIRVRSDLQPGTLPVLGFESKLQQVFLNLFINARDAMPRGGWLSVTTRADGPDAIVEVADTGTGISPDVLERIYDPFFTTKPMGQGTGLGLAITYGIVREHDAAIQCQSASGQGTRFTVRFTQAMRPDHQAAV
jgi:PAS domain S-box-containing protein